MVLLAAPAVALATGRLPAVPGWVRRGMALMFVLPAINWVATYGGLNALSPSRPLWLLLTAVNSTCLLLLLAGFLGIAFVWTGRSRIHTIPIGGST
jgi:hypothetical protein